ncbi:BREX-1 system phosphatase PglZ type A [Metabacillus bambusae]|uniref:BREX-1 system phosphatase PglZ type A n=1 Tax=Metabacillus bambusae TaxID=2795218 RepID=A0ABS3N5V1_9BACI|nr:BREX-1 system phosphatase PglZ type A [Metabacillus bambusae]MBO1513530.1 BREX-1 system phosphatase PglZ type A [Metabacillus bambusae]
MNIDEIVKTLKESYDAPLRDGEQRKIIFWLDKESSFSEIIDEIKIDNVKFHKLNEGNFFYSKYLLEEEDTDSNYLIYSNVDIQTEEENWLIDTFLYSNQFYADKISLLMNELKIDSSLRHVIKKYEKFFDKIERRKRFKALEIEQYTEEKIELAIISALCNLKTLDTDDVLKKILINGIEESENKYFQQMDKFFDIDVFWKYVSQYYGFYKEEKSLKKLLIHLTVTAMSHSMNEKYLSNIKEYIAEKNRANSMIFIDHWMHHKTDYTFYDNLAEIIEKEIHIHDLINALDIENFKHADVFPYFDKAIIIYIANSLDSNIEDFEQFIDLIQLRRTKHYYEQFQYIYEALFYTVKMHQFHKKYNMGIPQVKLAEMYQLYLDDFYKMDTYYRKFYVAFDNESNSDLLKKLKSMVENLYTNWYMGQLSSNWSSVLSDEMKKGWKIPGIESQMDFYKNYVSQKVQKGDRVFVIISDALRYEVAVELNDKLNTETIGNCEIEGNLGVIPSVTKLGMASLLPYKQIEIKDNGRVYVDSKDSQGLENRKNILEDKVENSMAIHYQEIMAMNKAGRREHFKGKKLNYIYHDSIDATGDKASTEFYTFNAVEKAIEELYNLVKVIKDDLSGTNIFITADHGFIYQRDSLEESDKIEREDISSIEVKRRYLLSKEQKEIKGLLNFSMDYIIGNDSSLTVYMPNSTIRFKTQGSGANFVHGGASLQEVVVPVIQFKNIRRGQSNSKEIEKVDIKLTNTVRKITNSLFNLTFFQTEKVEDKVVPRTVNIYMADENDALISNEETIIGDKQTDKPDERTFRVKFALKSQQYDKNKYYYLIIKDSETDVIIEKIPFQINLGIVSDFDF